MLSHNSLSAGKCAPKPKQQENLWRRVLSRRIDQLSLFNHDQLKELSGDKNVSSKSLSIKIVRIRLEGYFNGSTNLKLRPAERSINLSRLKALLSAIDSHNAKAVLSTYSRNKKTSIEPSNPVGVTGSSTAFNSIRKEVISSGTKNTVTASAERNREIDSNTSTNKAPTSESVPCNVKRRYQKDTTSKMGRVLSKISNGLEREPETIGYLSDKDEGRTVLPVTYITSSLAADNMTPTLSQCLTPRSACDITCNQNSFVMSTVEKNKFDARMRTWDPFWIAIHDFSKGSNKIGGRGIQTGKICGVQHMQYGEKPQSCASIKFTVPPCIVSEKGADNRVMDWGYARTDKAYRDGERRLILRMLQIPEAMYNKKADMHIFPKGTFIQINRKPISGVIQRKQQSHDKKLWKGMCHSLDITPSLPNPSKKTEIDMIFIEKEIYGLQLAICEYRSPEKLFHHLSGRVKKISYEDGLSEAKRYINCQTVVIDDDSDSGEVSDVSLTFQLTCPISMRPMEVPVRGSKCKHMQCFDLRTFLHSNSFPSGHRWRCACCELFVNASNLVVCGLFERMLQQHKEAAERGQDKIQFKGDGSWGLLEENKKRAESGGINGSASNAKKKKIQHDIITI